MRGGRRQATAWLRRCLREVWLMLVDFGSVMYAIRSTGPHEDPLLPQVPVRWDVPDAIDPTGRPVWFERGGTVWTGHTDPDRSNGGTRP
ncbi:hypothetical protein [Streptomyces sp. CA2R101]|uniref:hypothetical protein n=1 Tax=Streptomyces sp. CA2R101 TaxID=3120152 RepID=UPI003008C5A1